MRTFAGSVFFVVRPEEHSPVPALALLAHRSGLAAVQVGAARDCSKGKRKAARVAVQRPATRRHLCRQTHVPCRGGTPSFGHTFQNQSLPYCTRKSYLYLPSPRAHILAHVNAALVGVEVVRAACCVVPHAPTHLTCVASRAACKVRALATPAAAEIGAADACWDTLGGINLRARHACHELEASHTCALNRNERKPWKVLRTCE